MHLIGSTRSIDDRGSACPVDASRDDRGLLLRCPRCGWLYLDPSGCVAEPRVLGASSVSRVAEHVRELDARVRWEPNAPEAVLISADSGRCVLALNAHPDDGDQRCVVFTWSGTHSATMSNPNDEPLAGHRLYAHGLAELRWIGVVDGSVLIDELERINDIHPIHNPAQFASASHYVIPLKECVIEVVANVLVAERRKGTTSEAAVNSLG